ncbi:hypothetical protein [Streptomyces roseochromogenus]|uniref:Uncharacterized protein n=1 Tax=Streptomyces roseochromogenus subsp. oscitans DS 12.976 TaxID=1352936 RepID=V6KTP4_STRRC|nr:hypothetical protein [Streptomyces roseochromogenus]EST35388.1 hypothetical protein M878_06090 [Streptomyces roseochromogenus subsp. oscitans DS 12.976]
MAGVTEQQQAHPSMDAPIDAELILDAVSTVLAMSLSTSTRQQIDDKTTRLIGQLSMLLAEELGVERDEEVVALVRASSYLLDMGRRPTETTPAYEAFAFMRDVAIRTRSLLAVYTKRNGIAAP